MDIKYLGNSIKHHRKRLRMTQENLADKLFVSPNYIYELEKSHKTPSLQLLINMSEIFGVSIDSLFMPDIATGENGDKEEDKLVNLVKTMPADDKEIIYELILTALKLKDNE